MFDKAIKWLMPISGALTLTMLYAAIVPEAAIQAMFGENVPVRWRRVNRRPKSTPIGVEKGPPFSLMLHEAEASARTARVCARSHRPVRRYG